MTSAELKRLRTYLEENKTRHIERIQKIVQQPSVSTENLGVAECAELLAEYHRELGCHEVALLETEGLPGLWAYYDAGAPKTIAVYGNFDTRPVLSHEQWEHPAFSAALASFGPYPRVLVGRGSFAYKGPYVAWLNALEALIAVTGTLPVNVMTLLEGDEILGSPNFRDMYAQYRDRLVTADASLSPGASQDASGRVNLSLGYKGMICSELIASGDRWGRGPLGQPLHGMTESVVDSPVWRLTHALSTLTAADSNRVTVKGFYEDLTPPTEEERRAVQSYRDAMGGGPWNKILPGLTAARVPVGDLGDEETVLNYFYGPSFNINGLRAGFTGPGTLPFSLPHEALASFDIRLPRGYSAEKVIRLLREHLDGQGYEDVELRVLGAFDPCAADIGSLLVRSILRTFRAMGVPMVVAPYSGAGGPWSLFANDLGLTTIRSVGLGSGGNVGGPNEYFVVDGTGSVGGLVECELSHIHMLKSYAGENDQ